MEDKSAEQVIRESLGKSGGWKKNALGATEANAENRYLKKRTNTDRLTKLDNEYSLQDMLMGLQNRWEKGHAGAVYMNGTFVILDLNGLHDVNHKFGKLAGGNGYLLAVADVLIKTARNEAGRCFRNGKQADEFTLYLPGVVLEEQITSVINQIDSHLNKAQQAMQEIYTGINFSLSYCVATFHRGYGPIQAFTDAENKMGEAKTPSTNGERVGSVGRLFVNKIDSENLSYE